MSKLHFLFFSFLFVNFGLVFGELTQIIDLTWDFSNETIYWIGMTTFRYTKTIESDSDRGYWYSMKEFCTAEHGGTHFDAPYHFNKEGWKVAEVPIERLLTKGATIDLSQNGTKLLQREHLENWVHINGNFENNTVLLVKFGWSKHWPKRDEYFAIGPDQKMNFPGLSPEAATWIAQNGKIVGVGLDTPSVDPGSSTDFMAHRILSKNQIYVMENVKILADLPAKGFSVVALPMKLKSGTGAPLRIVAFFS